MDFWKLIESSKSGRVTTDDVEGQLKELQHSMASLSLEELKTFEMELRRVLHELYRGDVVDLCIMLDNDFETKDGVIVFEDGISDEWFLYFRCWLVLQGKQFFDALAESIENIVDHSVDIADTWGEGLLYVADEVYASQNKEAAEFFVSESISAMGKPTDYDNPDEELKGEPQYIDHALHYPKIVKRISEIKDSLD